MAQQNSSDREKQPLLNTDQEALLDQYILHLDVYFEALRRADAIQVEIETQHLKKILTT